MLYKGGQVLSFYFADSQSDAQTRYAIYSNILDEWNSMEENTISLLPFHCSSHAPHINEQSTPFIH